jgi:small subunit ribosomal protein S17
MKTQSNDNGSQKPKIGVRGRTFRGVVIADAMQKTVTIEWDRRQNVKKYERYEKKRSRVKAHNPENINAKKGDLVEIRECRPLSKTKQFIIIKKLGEERLFAERESALEKSKVPQHKTEKEEAKPKKIEHPVEEEPEEIEETEKEEAAEENTEEDVKE